MVVAFFLIAYHPPFWPLCVGCAVAATGGRCVLTRISEHQGRRLLSVRQQKSVAALGDWLNRKSGWSQALAVLIYASGPIPSNQLFIAAGLAGARLGPIAAGFLAGRLISYPFFAATARGISDHFGNIFIKEWKDPKFVVLELLSIAGVIVFAHIDWPRLLHLPVSSARPGSGTSRPASSDIPIAKF